MSSLPLFDKVFSGTPDRMPKLSGRDLRDSGLKSVFRHTPEWYRDAFESAVIGFARGRQFTVEDVREIAGDPPDSVSSNCMGSLMTVVAKKKLAKKTGQYVKAKRSGMHATDLACWERL
jgi:hypothetical protein